MCLFCLSKFVFMLCWRASGRDKLDFFLRVALAFFVVFFIHMFQLDDKQLDIK